MARIRGVNLGNWLVLEKWMSPTLFDGTTAEDETELCFQLGNEKYPRLKTHRDTYITKSDFEFIAAQGLNAVRIPVPHFIFDDCAPYVGCIEHLDRAFEWANQTDLKILIDLHTARDSQNGFDNGGICGVCKWHLNAENIEHTICVLEQLATRYLSDPALYGIELLNEPISPDLFNALAAAKRYPPHDPMRAVGSCGVPESTLRVFYDDCYTRLRKIVKPETVLMFHDSFRLKIWSDFWQDGAHENVVLDTHPYVCFAGAGLNNPSLKDILDIPLKGFAPEIKEMRRHFPVCIGEWCFAFPQNAFSESDTPLMRDAAICAAAAAQVYVFEQADAWFYWSYKLLSKPQGWDFREAVSRGWMPQIT